MRFSHILTRTLRPLIIVLALLALLPAHPGISHAGATYGVVNGSFGRDGACSLEGWTTSGTVGTSNMTEYCYAILQVNVGVSQDTATSYLEQEFLVDPAQPTITFYVNPTSDLPGGDYPAQTISLYDSTGQVIYEQSRNIDVSGTKVRCNFGLSYDLSAYSGQLVRLRISVKASTERGAPTNVSMSVDFDKYSWPCEDGGPETTPGGPW